MTELFVSASVAFAATSIFAFQFGYWKSRKLLAGFFLIIATFDWLATTYYLPEGLVTPLLGFVCLGIGILAHRDRTNPLRRRKMAKRRCTFTGGHRLPAISACARAGSDRLSADRGG